MEGAFIRVVGDAELFDLFKDRPVVLIGKAGNQKLLLWTR